MKLQVSGRGDSREGLLLALTACLLVLSTSSASSASWICSDLPDRWLPAQEEKKEVCL